MTSAMICLWNVYDHVKQQSSGKVLLKDHYTLARILDTKMFKFAGTARISVGQSDLKHDLIFGIVRLAVSSDPHTWL